MDQKPPDWDYIKTLCHAHIRSYQQYRELIDHGLEQAHVLIQEKGVTLPDRDDLRQLHRIAFGAVYPFAGSFRNQGVRFAPGRAGAFPTEISRELDRLRDESLSVFAAATSKAQVAQAICSYHAKFELIHPFLDGNGRMGRLVIANQARELLSSGLRLPDPKTYLQAIDQAQSHQDIGPLAKSLFGVQLSPELSKPPHSIELQPFVYNHALPSGRVVQALCNNPKEAEAVMLRLESPELIKQLEELPPEAEIEIDILQLSQPRQEPSREIGRQISR